MAGLRPVAGARALRSRCAHCPGADEGDDEDEGDEAKPTLYVRRLGPLLEALGPAQVRGSYGEEEERRQVHFVAREGAWRFTYDTVYGHNLRVAVPPDAVEEARARVAEALERAGLVGTYVAHVLVTSAVGTSELTATFLYRR